MVYLGGLSAGSLPTLDRHLLREKRVCWAWEWDVRRNTVRLPITKEQEEGKGNLAANAMERVAAGVQLPCQTMAWVGGVGVGQFGRHGLVHLYSLGRWKWKEKLTAYAMISRLLRFLSLRNAQTIEPTTAWTAVPSPSGNPLVSLPSQDTRFYTWVDWGAPYERTVVRARPNEHYQRTGPPSSAD